MKGSDKLNKHSPIKPQASLLERASELYDFGAMLRGGDGTAPVLPVPAATCGTTRSGSTGLTACFNRTAGTTCSSGCGATNSRSHPAAARGFAHPY